MKLYDGGRAPNPRRTRIFLAEKGINLPIEQIDLGAMQQKSPAYSAINPIKRVPALVLDDGTVITELIAICRYFEELQPDPPLFGRGALEIARVEMWNRRLELHFLSSGLPCLSQLASGDEGDGSAAGAGLGRGQQAAHSGIHRMARPRAQGSPVRRRRQLHGGRHHRPGRRRLHEARQARRCRTISTHLKRWHADVSARPSAAA